MVRFKIDPNDTLANEAVQKKLKVYSSYNPYFVKDTQVEISTLEQIPFYHKKLRGSRIIGEFVKDSSIKKRRIKKYMKHLMKYWDKDFKDNIDLNKNAMLDKNKVLRKKRIRRIRYFFVYLFTLILIASIFVSKRVEYLKNTPLIKNYVNNFYDLIEEPFYYNLLIALIYVSLFAICYIVLLRTYFETFRKVGSNSEKFIRDEFKKIDTSYNEQHKKIKRHLYKSTSKRFKKNFEIKKIFDPSIVLSKLDEYSLHIEEKVTKFRKKYYWLLLLQFLLKISVLGLTGYLGYMYYVNF